MRRAIIPIMILVAGPDFALARHCHWAAHSHNRPHQRRVAGNPAHNGSTTARETTPQEINTGKNDAYLDARDGKTLKQALSELGADVDEWGAGLSRRLIKGSYQGPAEGIVRDLLADSDFVVFRDHSRLRVIVVRLGVNAGLASGLPAAASSAVAGQQSASAKLGVRKEDDATATIPSRAVRQ